MTEVRKMWSDDEDHAIRTLVKKYGTKRWAEVSKQMLDHFGHPARSGKQCRERWHNHLNPKINKNPWTQEEERALFRYHQVYGNKWKDIASCLPGRTDNDIKNKFYSSIRKKLRKLNKLLGRKDSTSQVKKIKPHVLSKILTLPSRPTQQMREDWEHLSKLLYDFDDKKCEDRSLKKEEMEEISELVLKIDEYNRKYIENKGDKGAEVEDGQSNSKEEDNGEGRDRQMHNSRQVSNLFVFPELKFCKNESEGKQSQILFKGGEEGSSKDEGQQKGQSALNLFLSMDESMMSLKSNFFGTPFLAHKSSSTSNQNGFKSNDFLMASPNLTTRSSFRNLTTPSPGMNSFPCLQASTIEIKKNQTYDNIISSLQNKLRKNQKNLHQ